MHSHLEAPAHIDKQTYCDIYDGSMHPFSFILLRVERTSSFACSHFHHLFALSVGHLMHCNWNSSDHAKQQKITVSWTFLHILFTYSCNDTSFPFLITFLFHKHFSSVAPTFPFYRKKTLLIMALTRNESLFWPRQHTQIFASSERHSLIQIDDNLRKQGHGCMWTLKDLKYQSSTVGNILTAV